MGLPIVVALLLCAVILIACLAFRKALRRPASLDFRDDEVLMHSEWFAYRNILRPAVDWVYAQDWQELCIQSADGLTLKGLWLPRVGSDTALILMHGYGSLPQNDGAVSARWAAKRGYSVFLPWQRGYGESQGKYTSLGLLEAEDCRRWAQKIRELMGPDCKIILGGVSMGSATLFHALEPAAKGTPLPENVRAVVCDCGYTSVKGILKHIVKKYLRMRSFPLLQVGGLYFRLCCGVWPGKTDALEYLKETKLPIFFSHGKADRLVPYEMTQAAYDACASEKHLFTGENAGHGASALAEQKRYYSELETFLAPFLK